MPIYAYRCAECGHTKDVLRKLSDPPLSLCPACGAEAFQKQVTAAGFQLKGSGWYVTDFKGGNAAQGAKQPGADGDGKAEGKAEGKTEAKAEGKKAEAAAPSGEPVAAKTPAAAATPSATSAGGTGSPGSGGAAK